MGFPQGVTEGVAPRQLALQTEFALFFKKKRIILHFTSYLLPSSAPVLGRARPGLAGPRGLVFLALLWASLAAAALPPVQPQTPADLLVGETWAVAYSGYRDGQHPDLGEGARPPTDAQIAEDLRLLVGAGFRLIRLYDSGDFAQRTLAIIRDQQLPLRVLGCRPSSATTATARGCSNP